MNVPLLPGNNGWSAGGYNFILNSSGEIEYGRPDTALKKLATVGTNPIIQNGFYQFAQNTKPTQRAAGVPLVAGDRWFNTSNGTEWFWNGTYWLSQNLYKLRAWTGSAGATGTVHSLTDSPVDVANVFFEKNIISSALMVSPQDSSNYWEYYWNTYSTPDLAGVGYTTSNLIANGTTNNTIFSVTINTAVFSFLFADGVFAKVGSPGSIRRTSMSLTYRIIAP